MIESEPLQRRKQARFDKLMRAGDDALSAGKRRLAHDLWREAATLKPECEPVWWALLNVLDTPEDRRVCLRNILALNPTNEEARRKLRSYELHHAAKPPSDVLFSDNLETERPSLLSRLLLIGGVGGLSGVIAGVVVSILVYGF